MTFIKPWTGERWHCAWRNRKYSDKWETECGRSHPISALTLVAHGEWYDFSLCDKCYSVLRWYDPHFICWLNYRMTA